MSLQKKSSPGVLYKWAIVLLIVIFIGIAIYVAIPPYLAYYYRMKADAGLAQERWSDAFLCYKKALYFDSENEEAQNGLVLVELMRISDARSRNDNDAVYRIARELVYLMPYRYEGYEQLGFYYRARGDYHFAISFFRKALERTPRFREYSTYNRYYKGAILCPAILLPAIHMSMAELYIKTHDAHAAFRHAKAAMGCDINHWASECFTKSSQLKITDAFLLSVILLRVGRAREALELCRSAYVNAIEETHVSTLRTMRSSILSRFRELGCTEEEVKMLMGSWKDTDRETKSSGGIYSTQRK